MINSLKNKLITTIKASESLLNFVAATYSFGTVLRTKGRKKNSIKYTGSMLKNTSIQINGSNNSIFIAPKNRLINCKITIIGTNCKLYIENNCTLKNLELWLEDNGSEIFIGNTSSMEGGHIAATEGESIKIGNDCMFSHRIEIRSGDSHSIYQKDSDKRINNAKPVVIGSHVWLGADAKILKGAVIIGGAVIATGAVVTGVVEANSIYAGNPAKKVKENIYWDRERK
ncbi:MAG: acyltransferase [Paludibacter sp.]|nr:acyltransferase [Paludibacter sp.]